VYMTTTIDSLYGIPVMWNHSVLYTTTMAISYRHATSHSRGHTHSCKLNTTMSINAFHTTIDAS
jgi:hypothetical protein